jgi:integral membrane protein (TIGR01906 family)
MQDVKDVVRLVVFIGYGLLAFLLLLALVAHFRGWGRFFLDGIRRGAWLTIALVLIIAAFAVLSFWQFFSLFHALFFAEGSWLFLYSDTLIRLFPLRYWQDIFITAGVLLLLESLLLVIVLHPKGKRTPA